MPEITTTITPMPTAPQRTQAPVDFATTADTWVAAMPARTAELNQWASEANALVNDVIGKTDAADLARIAAEAAQIAAEAAKAAAETAVGNAATSATAATTSEANAATSETNAANSAAASAASADEAEHWATALREANAPYTHVNDNHSYQGVLNGQFYEVELAALRTEITPNVAGNKIKIQAMISGETDNNGGLFLTRQIGADPEEEIGTNISTPSSRTPCMTPFAWDNNQATTASNYSLLYVDNPESQEKIVYRVYARWPASQWFSLNHVLTTGSSTTIEESSSTVLLEELGQIGGKSTYEIWLENGNTGTQADFLLDIRGEAGATGGQGLPAGGTSGQVLIKQAASDFDTAWENISWQPYDGLTAEVIYDASLDGEQSEFQTPDFEEGWDYLISGYFKGSSTTYRTIQAQATMEAAGNIRGWATCSAAYVNSTQEAFWQMELFNPREPKILHHAKLTSSWISSGLSDFGAHDYQRVWAHTYDPAEGIRRMEIRLGTNSFAAGTVVKMFRRRPRGVFIA